MGMKSISRTFLLGIFAGILIAIGGAINLQLSSIGQPIWGAVFFSFGLMCVCILQANLFTGKVGYVLEKDKRYALNVLIMSIGNIIGALAMGYLCGALFSNWTVTLDTKLLYGENATWWGSALRAVLAGVFVYLAVECFRLLPSYPAKLVMVCLSIATMVLLGANHSVANAFYFAYGQIRIPGFDGLNATLSVIVAMVGNSLGSLAIYGLQNGFKKAVEAAKKE